MILAVEATKAGRCLLAAELLSRSGALASDVGGKGLLWVGPRRDPFNRCWNLYIWYKLLKDASLI